jgi:hypothetical protein
MMTSITEDANFDPSKGKLKRVELSMKYKLSFVAESDLSEETLMRIIELRHEYSKDLNSDDTWM